MIKIESQLQKLQRDHFWVFPLFFLVLVFFKGFDRFRYAGIWAEDGQVFLKHAFEVGWPSLFDPYAGYFHTLPRITALITSWLPIEYIPYCIVSINYILFAIIISYIIKKEYRWLFPDVRFALLAALFLFLSPGQGEMLGNLTNIHWYLLLWLGLLGLKDINSSYTWAELLFVFLCIASEGAAVIMLPLFCIRLYLKWKKRETNSTRKLLEEGYIISLILFFTIFCLFLKTGESSTSISGAHFKVFYRNLFNFLIVHPFAGDNFLFSLQDIEAVLIPVEITIALFLLFQLYKNHKTEKLLLYTFILCSLCLPVMISMARPENLQMLIDFSGNDNWFSFRYSFFVVAAAGILWSQVFQNSSVKKIFFLLLFFCLIGSQFLNYQRFFIREYGKNGDWQKRSQILTQSLETGCPKKIYVQIYPKGWLVKFVSPVEAECK